MSTIQVSDASNRPHHQCKSGVDGSEFGQDNVLLAYQQGWNCWAEMHKSSPVMLDGGIIFRTHPCTPLSRELEMTCMLLQPKQMAIHQQTLVDMDPSGVHIMLLWGKQWAKFGDRSIHTSVAEDPVPAPQASHLGDYSVLHPETRDMYLVVMRLKSTFILHLVCCISHADLTCGLEAQRLCN